MRSTLIPIGPLAVCLLFALAAPVAAESYLGAGASAAQVKRALMNTRSLSRPKPVTEAAAQGSASRAGKRQAAAAAPGKRTAGAAARGGIGTAPKPSTPSRAGRAAAAAGGAAVAAAAVGSAPEAAGEEDGGPASFEIFFDLNSATLRKDSLPVLDRLGVALTSPELQDFRFVVEGHTDASGSEATNQLLSENRAKSVRDYLVERHHVDPARLEPRGRGATDLYDAADPFSPKNRRVRFVNPDAGAADAAPETGAPDAGAPAPTPPDGAPKAGS